MRYGMVIDLKRCISCYACQMACKTENGTPPGVLYAWAFRIEQGEYPNTRQVYLPMLCNHCDEPSCVDVCPTGATHKREEDGIVVIDPGECVGCRACMTACPYHARYYLDQIRGYYPGQGLTPYEKAMYPEHNKGTVEKCDFCRHRLERGEEPACVANCPAVARIFGDLDDPESEPSRLIKRDAGYQLLPEQGNDPSVYYLPAERPAKGSIQNEHSPTGCDGRVRGKNAGSARSGATGATEDDASCRPARTRRPQAHFGSSSRESR